MKRKTQREGAREEAEKARKEGREGVKPVEVEEDREEGEEREARSADKVVWPCEEGCERETHARANSRVWGRRRRRFLPEGEDFFISYESE